MIRFFKGISLLSLVLFFLLGALLVHTLMWEESKRRAVLVKWLHFIAPSVLKVLDIQLSLTLPEKLKGSENHFIVSNHLSYIDVLLIAATTPTVFVTSVEVKNSFLGYFAKAAGCLFVERRKRASVTQDSGKIASALREGFNVALFPEGTTSNGVGVLPFKGSLFASTIEALTPILPACINYRYVNGEEIHTSTADSIFYYGTMGFLPQLWRLLALENVWVELQFLPRVKISKESNRKDLALDCYKSIENAYIPVKPIRSIQNEISPLFTPA